MPKHLPKVDQAEPGLEQSVDSIPGLTDESSRNMDNHKEPPVSAADIELRNEFAKIAFAAIVAWQVENRKGGQEDVAASWAFRYADRAVAASKRPPSRGSMTVKGVPPPPEEPVASTEQALEPIAEVQ